MSVSRATRFETGGEYQAVELILSSVNDNAFLSHSLDAFAGSVYQRDVRSIKRWQVFVVKSWTFAPGAVPVFQSFGGFLILDNSLDSVANTIVALEVDNFSELIVIVFRKVEYS